MLTKVASLSLILTASLVLRAGNSSALKRQDAATPRQYLAFNYLDSPPAFIDRRSESEDPEIRVSPLFASRPTSRSGRNREAGLELLIETTPGTAEDVTGLVNPWIAHMLIAAANENRSREVAPKRQKKASPGSFTYMASPLSNQILPFRSERLAQGYREMFSLASPADNYRVGLRKTSSNERDQVATLQATIDQSNDCKTSHELVELVRNDYVDSLATRYAKVDQVVPGAGNNFGSGPTRLLRQCRGFVELARCDGHCLSSSQPSISSPDGISKSCVCCEYRELRSLSMSLGECIFPINGNRRLTSADNEYFTQPVNTMEVRVEEPYGCRCRKCDSSLRR